MRKIFVRLVLVFALIFGYGVIKSMTEERMSTSGVTSEESNLVRKEVKNPRGEDIGIITDVIAGPEGFISFAVLDYLVTDNTKIRIAVPFSAFSCGEQNCILNASRKTLDSAPTFVWENDLTDQKQAEFIYRHFGVQPYWTEKGKQN